MSACVRCGKPLPASGPDAGGTIHALCILAPTTEGERTGYLPGRSQWLDIADELSGDPGFLLDADPQAVRMARAFAAVHHVGFPPPADLDAALLMLDREEDRTYAVPLSLLRDAEGIAEMVLEALDDLEDGEDPMRDGALRVMAALRRLGVHHGAE